ncbi:MAG: hypothetical protein LEGION0398_MBIBDBAK_01382 [Legionellaceae bacterium]
MTKNLKIPLDITSCIRKKATLPQSRISANQRKKNIKNAFAIDKPLTVEHVAIFDDVVTTGFTVYELSKVLQKNGVKKIDIWTCARTVR